MLVVDEYIAVRVLVGDRPPALGEDEPLALPAYRHYRLLQRIHAPGTGQLSGLLTDSDQQAIRRPHPEVLQILDPRPLLDEAAAIVARYRSAGLLVGEPSPPDSPTATNSGSALHATLASASPRSPPISTSPFTSPKPTPDWPRWAASFRRG